MILTLREPDGWYESVSNTIYRLFGSAESSTEESGLFPSLNVAQLRQRIESYDGVVVLGTDDAAHLDPKLAKQCDEVVQLADD